MAKQLKIGFIQAKNRIDIDWFRPLAFGYLKAYIEKHLDIPAEMCFLESLKGFEDFDIVAISSTSQDFEVAKEIACSAKQCKKEIVTILGGHHITYLPQTLPKEIDIGVMGEGEQTFLELVRLLSDNWLQIDPKDLEKIDGIVFHGDCGPTITTRRESIIPLDRIPFPYRSATETSYLFSSRGCPYKCAFCASSAFWEKTRFFSAEYVVKEIEFLLTQFPELGHIAICDDLFIADLPRLKKIVHLMEEKGLCRKVSFSSSVRTNLINDELCLLLKRINVTVVGIGIESGSDRILKLLNKGVSAETNQKAIDTLHKHGIDVRCSLIIGCPTELEEEVRSTYEFVLKNIKEKKISPQSAVNILSPMPGTKIWNDQVTNGLIDIQNMDWQRLAVFASYRNSNIEDFDQWLLHRRNNNSVYLAEDTLPQERLYELMSHYEKAMKELEANKNGSYSGDYSMVSANTVNRFFPMGTLRRKIAKAFYRPFFARDKFKKNVKKFFSHTKGKKTYCSRIAHFFFRKMSSKQNEMEWKKWEEIYGEFDKTDYEDFTLRGLPNEATLYFGEIIKWAQDINPAPKRVLLAGENNDTARHLQPEIRVEHIYTSGLSNVDYEWNYENDPPQMGSFDLIISQAILEHLLNPYKHMYDLASLLTPGGYLIVHSVCPGHPYHRYPIDACRFYPDWFEEIAKRLNLDIIKKRIKDTINNQIFYMYQKPSNVSLKNE